MADVKTLARELLEWVREDPKRIKDLESHRSKILTGAVTGQSGAIVSASGNGVSFTQTAALDALQVARAIRFALKWYAAGTSGTSRTYAQFG